MAKLALKPADGNDKYLALYQSWKAIQQSVNDLVRLGPSLHFPHISGYQQLELCLIADDIRSRKLDFSHTTELRVLSALKLQEVYQNDYIGQLFDITRTQANRVADALRRLNKSGSENRIDIMDTIDRWWTFRHQWVTLTIELDFGPRVDTVRKRRPVPNREPQINGGWSFRQRTDSPVAQSRSLALIRHQRSTQESTIKDKPSGIGVRNENVRNASPDTSEWEENDELPSLETIRYSIQEQAQMRFKRKPATSVERGKASVKHGSSAQDIVLSSPPPTATSPRVSLKGEAILYEATSNVRDSSSTGRTSRWSAATIESNCFANYASMDVPPLPPLPKMPSHSPKPSKEEPSTVAREQPSLLTRARRPGSWFFQLRSRFENP